MGWTKLSDSLYSNDTTPHLLYLENGSWKIKKTNYDTDQELSLTDIFSNPVNQQIKGIIGQIIKISPLSKISIPSNYLLCNGQTITDTASPNLNKRVKNLNGSSLNLTGAGTTGQNYIVVSSNDINALNVGDFLTGTGIPLNSVINEIDPINNKIYITNPLTATFTNGKFATVNLSGNVSAFTVTGNTFDLSSDPTNWDTMQGHWHQSYSPNSISPSLVTSIETFINTNNTPQILGFDHTREPKADGTNGTPKTGNKTKNRTSLIEHYECIKNYE